MSPYRALQRCEAEVELPATVELDFDPAVEGAMWVVPVVADRGDDGSEVQAATARAVVILGGFVGAAIAALGVLASR